jgi:hypothetical protein
MAILELAESILVFIAKIRLVELVVKFTNMITNLSLTSDFVNVRFLNRVQTVSRLLTDVAGRCRRDYLLAFCHQFRINFRGLPSFGTRPIKWPLIAQLVM